MVEIEAAQVVLVGFALAGVLGDDQAGRGLEELAGARIGLLDDALAGPVLLAGGILRLGLAGLRGDVDDLGQVDGFLRGRRRRDRGETCRSKQCRAPATRPTQHDTPVEPGKIISAGMMMSTKDHTIV